MKKVFICAAVALIFGVWWWIEKGTENTAPESAKIKFVQPAAIAATTPSKSVNELNQRYEGAELTPVQKRLLAAGFYPDRIQVIKVTNVTNK